jgi:BirA family biotin operon repressor/biotin-[acetyl-CoA-carboxylase] ligase
VPSVLLYERVGSTMDVAHAIGDAGAPAGTLILAETQTAGRGRHGSPWLSAPDRGIWLTLVERPSDVSGLQLLSLRVGVAAACALDAFASTPVQVKWPNDLYAGGGKLAGVLVEARWHGDRADWVAIGVGLNVVAPSDLPGATSIRADSVRVDVLAALVPAVRGAALRRGPLDERELAEFASRDYARDRRCVQPSRGVVAGVTATGELMVRTEKRMEYHHAGSLVLEEGA